MLANTKMHKIRRKTSYRPILSYTLSQALLRKYVGLLVHIQVYRRRYESHRSSKPKLH